MYTRLKVCRGLSLLSVRAACSPRCQSTLRNEIFFNLIKDYNRKHSVHIDLVVNAMKNIHRHISERRSLLVLTAAARSVHHITAKQRVDLLERVWRTLREQNVRLTARHYETYLSGLNENGFIFDADHYVNLIVAEELPATPRLYSLLLQQYCRRGDQQRAERFLKFLHERQIRYDEDIFAALIVGQLKNGNDKGAKEMIETMKEQEFQPTISTYKEILTVLIREHQLELFREYFRPIDWEQDQISACSTLYIDASFLLHLLDQCLAANEQPIFEFLFNRLKHLKYTDVPQNIFNLAIQCVANGWHSAAIELIEMRSEMDINDERHLNGRHWTQLFKHLLNEDRPSKLLEIYVQLMLKKKLVPLDALLRVLYTRAVPDYHLALDYLERGQELGHPMRTNYFYPLFLAAFRSMNDDDQWTDDTRLRLFRLLNRVQIPIESSTYSRFLQQSIHRYYQKNFSPLLEMLSSHRLESILDRMCRLFLNDIRRGVLDLKVTEQIVPFFRLQTRSRQEELAKYLFSIITGVTSTSNDEHDEENDGTFTSDCLSVFNLIDSISESLSTDVPTFKREVYTHLLHFSAEEHRKDLTDQIAERCLKENIQIGASITELNALTRHTLPYDTLEQLSAYRDGQLSWTERLTGLHLGESTSSTLEQIYREAKDDGRYPLRVQQRLFEIYVQKRQVNDALTILGEMRDPQAQIDSVQLHRLFDSITAKLDEPLNSVKCLSAEQLKVLTNFYDRSFGLKNLPGDLTFRLARLSVFHRDPSMSIALISNQISTNLNDEIFHYLIRFLQVTGSALTVESLHSLAHLLLDYRPSEPIRQFWKVFFDILLEKSNSLAVVEFFSEALKRNSNLPYLHLFELFIKRGELNRLQDIVDLATAQHGSQNISHDLAFALIDQGKIKQAERIFQMPWFRVRNDRINLHALLLADAKNLDGLVDAIKLTRNLPGVELKQLFVSAMRVALHSNQSDILHWLIKEMQEKKISLDNRQKRFLNVHLLSKGLDPFDVELEETRDNELHSSIPSNDHDSVPPKKQISARN